MFNPPLPHDEADELALFRLAFAAAMQKAVPVCSPPVVKTDIAQGLAALAVSGRVGGSSWINAEQAAIRAISASLLPSLGSIDELHMQLQQKQVVFSNSLLSSRAYRFPACISQSAVLLPRPVSVLPSLVVGNDDSSVPPLMTCSEFREAVTLRAESAAHSARRGPACGKGPGASTANPDGNHGDNKTLATVAVLECL